MLAVTAFFAALAIAALWACWRDRDLFWVGLWLVINCAVTNVVTYLYVLPAAHPIFAAGAIKPGLFTFVEGMTAVAAFFAWSRHRAGSRAEGGGLVALLGFNLLSIGFNVALATHFLPNEQQIFTYEATTNAIFVAECLLAFSVGVANGIRVGRFSCGFRARRRIVAANARRAKGPTAS